MKKPTITDIAKALNITPSTVSRALANDMRVKASTRNAVEAMAKEIGYERNVMASNLRRGISTTVGIIVPRINMQFFSNVISSVENILGKAGYNVIICQTHDSYQDEIKALKTMRNNQVAGIIISHALESVNGEHILKNISEKTTIIQFDRVFNEIPGIKITNDGIQGAYLATKCLIEKGYKKIGSIEGNMSAGIYQSRDKGYRKALKESKIAVDESLVFKECIGRESGYESARQAIKSGCDALYCMSDFTALGAMDAAREANLRVPEDFGIIGTANENFTSMVTPEISSLEQNPNEIGEKAAEAFLESKQKEEKKNTEIVIPMKLIERQSSNRI